MHLKLPIFAASILLFPLPGAQAASSVLPIGSTLTVVNLVTGELDRDLRTLQNGDKVHQDENITVSADGSSELKLDDDTKLALGPGSRLTLDKFVYDPNKRGGSIVINLAKGTFRFITGVASKPAYLIRTPSAAITVRGTILDLYIRDNGEVWGLLSEGAFEACDLRGRRCKLHNQPGKLIRITPDGDVGAPVKWAGLPKKDDVPFDTAFPFVVKPPGIDPSPIFTRDVIILGNLPEPKEEPKKERTEQSKPKKSTSTDKPKKATARTAKKDKSDEALATGAKIIFGIGVGIAKSSGGGRKGGGGDSGMGRSTGKPH
jgi:hypothetical protein